MPAAPGETVTVPRGPGVKFRLLLKRGPPARGKPLLVELIGNLRTGAPERLVSAEVSPEQDTFDWAPENISPGKDGTTAYVRARVSGKDDAGTPLLAYTNPIRLIVK